METVRLDGLQGEGHLFPLWGLDRKGIDLRVVSGLATVSKVELISDGVLTGAEVQQADIPYTGLLASEWEIESAERSKVDFLPVNRHLPFRL